MSDEYTEPTGTTLDFSLGSTDTYTEPTGTTLDFSLQSSSSNDGIGYVLDTNRNTSINTTTATSLATIS